MDCLPQGKKKDMKMNEKRRIEELREKIRKCRAYKSQIESFVSGVEKDYKKGILDSMDLKFKMMEYFKDKDPHEWIAYYDRKADEFRREIDDLRKKDGPYDGMNNRMFSIYAFMLFLLIGALLGNHFRLTGFAGMEGTAVFAGKEVYSVGDMAHIFVIPSDIANTVEVYGPDRNLIAISKDFPVEMPGNYTIKAVFDYGNKTVEVSSSFIVAETVLQQLPEALGDSDAAIEEDNASETAFAGNVSEAQSPEPETPAVQNQESWIRIQEIDVDFSAADMNEETVYDEDNNPVKKTRIEKEGIEIDVVGAGRDSIRNAGYRKGILHIDSASIRNATIKIPHPEITGITTTSRLYVKEDEETEFKEAAPYGKDGGWFNKIKPTPPHYDFSVEHFSDYYVNSTGGNYTSLTQCLFAINNTADTCIINEAGDWTINGSYFFFVGDNAIELNTGNIVLDCNGTIIKGNKTAQGVTHVRSGTNLTVRNCHMQDFQYGFNLDGYLHENITTYNISTNGSANVFQYGNQNVTDAWFNETIGAYGLQILEAFSRGHRYNNIHMTVRNNTYGFFLDQVDGGFFSNFTIEATDTETCVYFSNYPNTNTLTNFTINCGGMIGIDTREGTFNTIRDSNITNTSIAIIVQSGSNTIANNTIQESGNSTTVNFFKVSGSWYSFGGNDFNQTTPRLYNTALSAFVSIDSNDKDVSSIADGTNNFSLWLMDLTAVSLPFITLYIEQPNSLSCAAVAGAYGGTCYLDAQG